MWQRALATRSLPNSSEFAPYIVEAELGRTAVTDASFDTLSNLPICARFIWKETMVTGDGLAKLSLAFAVDLHQFEWDAVDEGCRGST
jgi:hypothetical protein